MEDLDPVTNASLATESAGPGPSGASLRHAPRAMDGHLDALTAETTILSQLALELTVPMAFTTCCGQLEAVAQRSTVKPRMVTGSSLRRCDGSSLSNRSNSPLNMSSLDSSITRSGRDQATNTCLSSWR